jgi:hypothetical protein
LLPDRNPRRSSSGLSAITSTTRDHQDARSSPADLQEDGGVRALRAHRARVHLGADRRRAEAQAGRGDLTEQSAISGRLQLMAES